MPEQKLFKCRVTVPGNQTETEPLPFSETHSQYQQLINQEVAAMIDRNGNHNWQIELLNEKDELICEFLLETTNN